MPGCRSSRRKTESRQWPDNTASAPRPSPDSRDQDLRPEHVKEWRTTMRPGLVELVRFPIACSTQSERPQAGHYLSDTCLIPSPIWVAAHCMCPALSPLPPGERARVRGLFPLSPLRGNCPCGRHQVQGRSTDPRRTPNLPVPGCPLAHPVLQWVAWLGWKGERRHRNDQMPTTKAVAHET